MSIEGALVQKGHFLFYQIYDSVYLSLFTSLSLSLSLSLISPWIYSFSIHILLFELFLSQIRYHKLQCKNEKNLFTTIICNIQSFRDHYLLTVNIAANFTMIRVTRWCILTCCAAASGNSKCISGDHLIFFLLYLLLYMFLRLCVPTGSETYLPEWLQIINIISIIIWPKIMIVIITSLLLVA